MVTFNGTDEVAHTPDASYWTRSSGSDDYPFSLGAWVNLRDATSSSILMKYDPGEGGASHCEWLFFVSAADYLELRLIDASRGSYIRAQSDDAIAEDQFVFLAATYNGKEAPTGITLYVDGSAVVDTDTVNPYTAMENTPALVRLGHFNATPDTVFDGSMAGGPLGPFFTHKELTADEVMRLYNLGRRALGV